MAPKRNCKSLRQRLGIKKDRHDSVSTTPLGSELKTLYRKGKMTATDVVKIARATRGNYSENNAEVAQWGASEDLRGKHASRTIMRSLGHTSILPPTYIAEAILWDEKNMEPCTDTIAFLPLHETLDAIVEEGKEHELCSIAEHQEGFRASLEIWAAGLGISLAIAWFACLSIWGDSAPYTNKDGLFLLLFSVISGVRRQKFWLCVFNKRRVCRCGCKGKCTFKVVFEMLAWSQKALILGKYPSTDHLGRPFPQGSWRAKMAGKSLKIRGGIIQKCADWQWFLVALNLCGWQGEGADQLICWLCNGGKNSVCNAYDFSLGAPWRGTMLNMVSHWERARQSRKEPSLIFLIPGFLIIFCIVDMMHAGCLGVLQYAQGNVVYELWRKLGGTRKKWQHACGLLENMFISMSKEMGVSRPFHSLTIGLFLPASNKPCLKLKAAEGRHCLPVLIRILQTFFPPTNEHEEMRMACIQALANVYDEMENWIGGGVSSFQIGVYARKHLLLYAELSRLSLDKRKWKLYPKHHLFQHCCENARSNPRLSWNYTCEAEMGAAVGLANCCNTPTLCRMVLEKYRGTFQLEPIKV